MRLVTTLIPIVALVLSITGCDDSGSASADGYGGEYAGEAGYEPAEGSDQAFSAGFGSASKERSASGPAKGSASGSQSSASKRVVIMDRGMNMPIGAIKHPPGWELRQDIATDLQTAQYARYVLDLKGPQGVIRGLGTATYFRFAGQEFEPAVESMVMAGLQGFDGIEFGEIEQNRRRMEQEVFEKGMQQARANGMDLQAVQAAFRATANGRPIAGRVEVDHNLFFEGGSTPGACFPSVS